MSDMSREETNNEVVVERNNPDGTRRRPSYIIAVDVITDENKKSAASFGIPIVLLDRDRSKAIELAIALVEENKGDEFLRNWVREFLNDIDYALAI